jgi:uncharacterized protein (DUF2235 family)
MVPPTTQNELSSASSQGRLLPLPIDTELANPLSFTESTRTPPSVGPGAYDASVVPPSHPDYRTLVLCFDGTGDQFDADVRKIALFFVLIAHEKRRVCSQNSNIVQFFSMLKKDDKSQQLVYYQVCRYASLSV